MIRRIIVVLLSLALSLLVAEIGLRNLRPVGFRAVPVIESEDVWRQLLHQASAIDGLAYELAPNKTGFAKGTTVTTNSHGMRGPELLADGPDLFRVAVVGDSFAFGFGVAAEQTFAAVLTRELRRSGLPGWRYEVLNFGVGGYSSRDEALVLQHRVLPLHPDVVIVAYALNDPEIEPIQPLHAYYATTHWWQHLHLARLIAATRWQHKLDRFGDGDYYQYLHAEPRSWQSVIDAFAEMSRATRETRTPLILAILTGGRHNDWKHYPYRALHEQIGTAAAEQHMTVADTLPFMSRFAPQVTRISRHDDHFSPKGHMVVARALYLSLAKLGTLPKVPADEKSR